MKQIGVNCFGLNSLFHADFEGTCRKLKEIGFAGIEPMVVFPEAMGMPSQVMAERLKAAGQDGAFWVDAIAAERIAFLRSMGFEVPGVHLGLAGMVPGGLETLLPYAAKFAKDNGLSYMVHSPQKKTIAEIMPDVRAMNKGIALLKEQGIELIFHCHYQEFTEDKGDTPFACMLREVPELRLELDVGWVQFAGLDVTELMDIYRDRIAIVHFKDIVENAAEYGLANIFTAIGEGCIPLEAIMKKVRDLPLSYIGLVIDQDASKGDMLEDLGRGFDNIQAL